MQNMIGQQPGRKWLMLRFASIFISFFIGFASIYETELDNTKASLTASIITFVFFFCLGYGAISLQNSSEETKSLKSWSQPFLIQPIGILDFMAWFFTVLGISFILFHWMFKPASVSFGLVPLLLGLGLFFGIRLKVLQKNKKRLAPKDS